MQGYKQLNSEPSDKSDRDSLEIITFDKFIQIHAKHFKWKNEMFPECQLFFDPNNIFLVFQVIIT